LDLGVGQKLTELAKILMSGSLKLLLFLKKKKTKHMDILKILIGFNRNF
jgi:hypothetical protein